MNSAGSTLRRLRTGNAKGMRPGQLIRYFLSGAFGDTDFCSVLLAISETPGPPGPGQKV